MRILLNITDKNIIEIVSNTIDIDTRMTRVYLGILYKQLTRVQRASFRGEFNVPLQQFLRHVTPIHCPLDQAKVVNVTEYDEVDNLEKIYSQTNIRRARTSATPEQMTEKTIFQVDSSTQKCYQNQTNYTSTRCPDNTIQFLPRRVKSVSIVALMFKGAIFDINYVSPTKEIDGGIPSGCYVAMVDTIDKKLCFKLQYLLDGEDAILDRSRKDITISKLANFKRARSYRYRAKDPVLNNKEVYPQDVRGYRGPLIKQLLSTTSKNLEFKCHKEYNCVTTNVLYPHSNYLNDEKQCIFVESSSLDLVYATDESYIDDDENIALIEIDTNDKGCHFHQLPADGFDLQNTPKVVQGQAGPCPQHYRTRYCKETGIATYLNATMFPTMPYRFDELTDKVNVENDDCKTTFLTASMLHDYIIGENQSELNEAAVLYGQRHEVDGLATMQAYLDREYQMSSDLPMRQVIANTKCKSRPLGEKLIGATPDGFVYKLPLRRIFQDGVVKLFLLGNSKLSNTSLKKSSFFIKKNGDLNISKTDVICKYSKDKEYLECIPRTNTCVCINMVLRIQNGSRFERWEHAPTQEDIIKNIIAVVEVKSRYTAGPPAQLSSRQYMQVQTQMYVWGFKSAFLISWGTSESRIFKIGKSNKFEVELRSILLQGGIKATDTSTIDSPTVHTIRSYHQAKVRPLHNSNKLVIFDVKKDIHEDGTLKPEHVLEKMKYEDSISSTDETLMKITNKQTGRIEYAKISTNKPNVNWIKTSPDQFIENVSAWQLVQKSLQKVEDKIAVFQKGDTTVEEKDALDQAWKTLVLRLAIFGQNVPIELVLTSHLAAIVVRTTTINTPSTHTTCDKIIHDAVVWYNNLHKMAQTIESADSVPVLTRILQNTGSMHFNSHVF